MRRIVFTSDEMKGIESVISYHFGHCPYFVIIDIENNEILNVESIENKFSKSHGPGELPQFIHELGGEAIVTGAMGPKAQDFFKKFQIQPIIGAYGKVIDVLEEILGQKPVLTYENKDKELESHIHEEIEEPEEEIRRLKMEVKELRRQIAEIKSILKSLKQ